VAGEPLLFEDNSPDELEQVIRTNPICDTHLQRRVDLGVPLHQWDTTGHLGLMVKKTSIGT
jgi:hypothetical protein